MNTARSQAPWLVAAWASSLLACVWAYWPGLAGPFVFDDFGTIADLGDLGGVRDWNSFKAFVLGGHAGPTGRPFALLTFLIDANNWPADPWPFKRTNLVIHLLSGILLGLLSSRVLKLLDFDRRKAGWCALIAAAVWLLHPFLVSTTLYAVQRMAQLSTLFVFAGLLGYLRGRSMIASRPASGYVVMTLSLVVFTLLSTVSKENGILLPLLAGVAEITIVASRRQQLAPLNRYWAIAFLVLPAAVVILYLGGRLFRDDIFAVVGLRDFSLYERILTQPRVLVDYLRHWYVPELYTTGIFQDHILKSESLVRPVTTLLSVLFHVAVIAVLVARRTRWPLAAFAGLFFYGAHLLESTTLNLELYFEHRNYLAAAFLFLPLVVALRDWTTMRVFGFAAVAVLLMLTGFTRYSATIWASYDSIVEASARKAPTSARAQQQYALNLFNEQRYDEAFSIIERAVATMPDKADLQITRTIMLCEVGLLSSDEFARVRDSLAALPYDPRQIDFYQRLSGAIVDGRCPDVSARDAQTLFDAMLELPANSDPQSLAYSQIQFLLGFAHVHLDKPTAAAQAFDRSLVARPGAGHAMLMASIFAANEYYAEALGLSDRALARIRSGQSGDLESTRISEAEIVDFQRRVREAMRDPDAT